MRIGVIPESLLERVALAAGLAPVPLAESWFPFLLARTIMVATRLGVYEALADGPADADTIAGKIGCDPPATRKLLTALTGIGHLRLSRGRFSLSAPVRKWLLAASPSSAKDKVLMQFLEWEWQGNLEQYLKSGQPLDVHANLTGDQWGLYQRGMRAGSAFMADEVASRFKLPAGATRMLDIGGSHGYFSVALCRKHAALSAVVLELPSAIEHAAPILARERMGDRVSHRAGDALTADLGQGEWDFILIASLTHHFDETQNRALVARAAAALRPGGALGIYEPLRAEGERVSQIGGLMELFFGLTSQSGTWSLAELNDWQRAAGLRPRRPLRSRASRDIALVAADKPRA